MPWRLKALRVCGAVIIVGYILVIGLPLWSEYFVSKESEGATSSNAPNRSKLALLVLHSAVIPNNSVHPYPSGKGKGVSGQHRGREVAVILKLTRAQISSKSGSTQASWSKQHHSDSARASRARHHTPQSLSIGVHHSPVVAQFRSLLRVSSSRPNLTSTYTRPRHQPSSISTSTSRHQNPRRRPSNQTSCHTRYQ